MDEVQFENWRQFITETLADVAVRQQAAEKRMDMAEKRMDMAEKRMDMAEKRMDRFESNLVRLARLGLRARSDLTARQKEHEAWQEEHARLHAIIDRNLAEITDKLNGLIGHVQDQSPPPQ